MSTQPQPDLATQMLHGLLEAGLNALPLVSPLDMVPAEQRQGRVDVLVSQILTESVRASGHPLAMAVYAKAKPLLDEALVLKLGPKPAPQRRQD